MVPDKRFIKASPGTFAKRAILALFVFITTAPLRRAVGVNALLTRPKQQMIKPSSNDLRYVNEPAHAR
jgi:hypothetical protein